MESALPLVTRLLNKTGHAIGFSVEEGSCPIPSLGPHGRRLVNLSEILNICRRRRSTSWLIKVLIDQKFTGMTLEPVNFFEYVQILFKFEINEEGKLIIIAEGIKEKNIDIVLRLSWNIGFLLGRNIIWRRRNYVPIADSLLVFPMSMQLIRQKDSKAGKDPESKQIETKDSLKKRVRSMCGDAAVVPEAIVNSNKRSPLRKEESPQTESDHSVKHIEVNPSKRKEKGLDLDNDTGALIQSKKVVSPESEIYAGRQPPPPLIHQWMDPNMIHSRSECQIQVKWNLSREREMVQIFIITTTTTTSSSLQSTWNMNMIIRLTHPTFQTRTPTTTSFCSGLLCFWLFLFISCY